MRLPLAALAVLALACGRQHSGGPQDGTQSFKLVLADRIAVHVGETNVITLLSVGASGAVSYDVKGLPPFASWSGSTIRVVPTRTDVPGDTTVTVTATDGAHSDSGTFIIGLADSPPSFDGAPQITTWSSQSGRDTATGLPVEATTTSLEVRG